MNNKSILLLIAGGLLSLIIVNCGSENNNKKDLNGTNDTGVSTETQLAVDKYVSDERKNDFPAGANIVTFDQDRNAHVVSNSETGCRILVEGSGSSMKTASEVDCSQ